MDKLFELMTFDNITAFIDKYGIFAPILLILVIFLIYGKQIFPALSDLLKRGGASIANVKKDKFKNLDMKSLTRHSFFYNVSVLLNVKIPNVSFGDEGRDRIFQDMLKIKLEVLAASVKKFIETETVTAENFLDKITNLVLSNLTEQECKWRAEGIPEVVIEKFKEWNSPRVEFLLKSIKDVDSTTILDHTREKMYVVMNLFNDVVYSTIFDSEKTLKYLNGQLNGVKYKSYIIGEAKK